MDDSQLRGIIVGVLLDIAPEVEAGDLVGSRPLRQQVDLDSMDWLNFLVGLHTQLRVEIPEADYRKLVSLDDLVAYLRPRIDA